MPIEVEEENALIEIDLDGAETNALSDGQKRKREKSSSDELPSKKRRIPTKAKDKKYMRCLFQIL